MSKRIKILHVVFSLEPGGMENGLVNLANCLPESEFEVHVACLEKTGAFVERLRKRGNIYVLGKKSGFSLSAVIALARLIARLKPNVIHSHNLGPLIYSAIATGMGLARPILHGEHSLLTKEECGTRRLRQRKLFYKACYKIHTVSEGLRQQIIALGLPERKLLTLLNGVDVARFSPGSQTAAKQQCGIPEQSFLLGIVGRFGPFKRHAILIEAFNQLASEWPDLHILIVGGGGTERERVPVLAKASPFANRIHLAGFQTDLPRFYRAMDLLVVPSINEGLSNVVLESMACGTPVLANDTCGNTEIITHGIDGVVADLSDVQKIRCELQKILVERSALDKMRQMARTSIATKFSIQVMVDNYAELYRQTAIREK